MEITKQSTPNFPKNEHFVRVRIGDGGGGGGKKCLFFGKFGVVCFLVIYLCFEIRPFALLPTDCDKETIQN